MLLLVTTVHDLLTLLSSALHSGSSLQCSRSSIHDPVRCAPARDVMHTVRNGIVLTLRRDSLNLRRNLSLYSVLASYTLRFEDLEES